MERAVPPYKQIVREDVFISTKRVLYQDKLNEEVLQDGPQYLREQV